MKITEKMCHSHLLWMLINAEDFEQAIRSYSATTPAYQFEGVAGYVETTVTFDVNDLEKLTKLYSGYHKLSSETRCRMYHTMCRGHK